MVKPMKPVKPMNIVCECIKCEISIERDSKLHCKNMILDLEKPFTRYSEVKVKRDCPYYREIR